MKDNFIDCWQNEYNDQIKVRLEKRQKMMQEGLSPYRNDLRPTTTCQWLREKFGELNTAEIEGLPEGQEVYKLAGRVLLVRDFGKAAFLKVDDGSGAFQFYLNRASISPEGLKAYGHLDYGDIIYAEGKVFRTQKGELSLNLQELVILTKSVRPLPEKFHGLSDPELRYRMRYVDMVMNPHVREVLQTRSRIIHAIREFFYGRNFLEVETPMLHSVVGGATARPFKTHHNALDLDMVLRIAPELHLKRLIVGGYPRVFEIGRNFRNEGLSHKHNPEFTSIEFYQAYATFDDLMELTEDLLSGIVQKIHGKDKIAFEDKEISFARPFKRMSIKESLCQYTSLTAENVENHSSLSQLLASKGFAKSELQKLSRDKLLVMCFEEFVEGQLLHPTFITEYPTEVSPLARRNDKNPEVVDRFELFINGWELANAFSELNNPTDQLERFAEQAQLKEKGDEEACDVDYDFVRALEYGMPPTAGEGIGVDRLCMLLTNSSSIRDVILFPQLKKENFFPETTVTVENAE